jgi:hypothetical protein
MGNIEPSQLKESDWVTGAEDGECRRHPPYLGEMIKTKNDEWRHFGEWPRVMFCDWCAEFIPRKERCPSGEARPQLYYKLKEKG